MAKRYHSSAMPNHHKEKFNDEIKHDKDSSQSSMYRSVKGAELYAGMEPKRRQELEDAGMIHEDHSAIANLPQNVMIKAYPKTGPYLPEIIDDTIRGVDGQMDYDDRKRAAHFYPKKV